MNEGVAERGDSGGLGNGGTGAQTWSPSSVMATGWLQLEHLTVGRICEMRSEAGCAAVSDITSVGV